MDVGRKNEHAAARSAGRRCLPGTVPFSLPCPMRIIEAISFRFASLACLWIQVGISVTRLFACSDLIWVLQSDLCSHSHRVYITIYLGSRHYPSLRQSLLFYRIWHFWSLSLGSIYQGQTQCLIHSLLHVEGRQSLPYCKRYRGIIC